MEKSRKGTGRDLKSRPALHGFGLVFKACRHIVPSKGNGCLHGLLVAFSGVRDARSSLV